MRLLAVETATEACSAALYDGGSVIERYRLAPREHSVLILPMVQSLLDEAGIGLNGVDALAFGCGPGSFTGVRIATGVIQGIALGVDLPVVRVSTLAALAQEIFDQFPQEYAYAAIDARMGEVYWGVYGRDAAGVARLLGRESVIRAEAVTAPEGRGMGVGSGWLGYPDRLIKRLGRQVVGVEPRRYPRAAAVARLGVVGYNGGLAVPAEKALPVYLRDKVAKKTSER